jgi:PhnB protein
MKAAHPYLNFPGNAEEAFNFYRSVFGGDFAVLVRFKDFGEGAMGVAESEQHKIAHVSLPLGDTVLMATDVVGSHGGALKVGNNVYISLAPDSAEEAERVFSALAAGGRVEMPLQQTEWAEKYGSCVDKFGVQWMVSYSGNVRFGGG